LVGGVAGEKAVFRGGGGSGQWRVGGRWFIRSSSLARRWAAAGVRANRLVVAGVWARWGRWIVVGWGWGVRGR